MTDMEWERLLDGDGDGSPLDEDCAPSTTTISSNASDPTQDDIDQNCDGVDGTDVDKDGFASVATGGEDCNDRDEAINPNATEVCDGADNDCDGLPEDSDAVDATTWYRDAEGDGYGESTQSEVACEMPEGYVSNSQDCDDADAALNPDSADYTADGIDQDCDGIDGYPASACDSPNLSMVLIPNGTFTMGSPEEEVGRDSDETLHQVVLTAEFCFAETELTQGQYTALMDDNPSDFDSCGEDCPVEQVSWHMAAAYTNALSDREGLESCYSCTGSGTDVECDELGDPYACEGYRLPTEAEWEYAARGGLEGEAFPSGGSLEDGTEWDCDNPELALTDDTFLADQAWYCSEAEETHPVGELNANGYGLYDMAGNVNEWTQDWFDDYSGDATDPGGAAWGSYRVNRGGAWSDAPRNTRVPSWGFRPARSLPSSP